MSCLKNSHSLIRFLLQHFIVFRINDICSKKGDINDVEEESERPFVGSPTGCTSAHHLVHSIDSRFISIDIIMTSGFFFASLDTVLSVCLLESKSMLLRGIRKWPKIGHVFCWVPSLLGFNFRFSFTVQTIVKLQDSSCLATGKDVKQSSIQIFLPDSL